MQIMLILLSSQLYLIGSAAGSPCSKKNCHNVSENVFKREIQIEIKLTVTHTVCDILNDISDYCGLTSEILKGLSNLKLLNKSLTVDIKIFGFYERFMRKFDLLKT